MTQHARILLIDDHALFRDGLRRIIEDEDGLSVVAQAGTLRDGLAQALNHRPDLILLDLCLADGSGLDLLSRLRRELPGTRLLVVSMYRDKEHILAALDGGADGYVTKDSVSEHLLYGLRQVLAGESYLDPSVSKLLLAQLVAGRRQHQPRNDGVERLTPREREIIQLLAEGDSVKTIAGKLSLSPKTVDTHRGNLMRKLGLKSTVDIVRYAIRARLLNIASWQDV